MRINLLYLILFLALCAALPGCSTGGDDDSSDDAASDDDTAADDTAGDDTGDDTGDDDTIPFRVIYDFLEVDGTVPPPNPATNDATPDVFNKIPMFRFRQDTGTHPPRPVKAVLILVAGYTAGANQLHFIARNLVEMSHGEIEVWALERRCHLLEDVYVSNLAEQRGDPWLAYNYYFNGAEVDGRTYQGNLDGRSAKAAMISEWGLALQLADYHRVVELVPEDMRSGHVFFGGHSRGAYFAQSYAAYEFPDGRQGSDDLAGLLLLDGAARYKSDYTQARYTSDLAKIRDGRLSRTTTFSFLSPALYTFLEVFAMATVEGLGDPNDPALGPDGHFPDYGPFTILFPLMTRFHHATFTNEAFMGMVSDDNYGLMENFHGHMGKMTGGEICQDSLGEYPCENGASYSWIPYNETVPHELMDLQRLASNIFEGPSNNADPYYPSRLDVDFYVADRLETAGTWRDDYFHFATSRMDAPVFAMGTRLVSGTGAYEDYRSQLPPARGQDRPREEYGFDILYNPDWEHIDGLQTDPQYNNVFPAVLDWINGLRTDEEVQIPVFGAPWTENPGLDY